jgi:hypothetical protein
MADTFWALAAGMAYPSMAVPGATEGPIRLTGQHDLQAGSVFCTQPVDVQKFHTIFRFQISGAQKADGLTFCIQGEGPRALGGPGGGLGHGPDPSDPLDPGFKVMKSVALKFDLIDDAIAPRSTMGLYRDGAAPTTANAIGGEIALDPLGISLQSGHHFRVTVSYDGAALTAVVRDQDLLSRSRARSSSTVQPSRGPLRMSASRPPQGS